MDIQQLKDLADATPFVRFVIELNSGKKVEVPTSDHIFFFPNQPIVFVVDSGGHSHIITMKNIAELVVEKIEE